MTAILEGGLLDALCAEPAIDALCRQSPSVALTVASAHADVYVGHPGISGILYLEPDNHPAGFDRTLIVPAAPAEATIAERIALAAEALGVQVDRTCPRIHLTSLDTLRTERLELGRANQPIIALCLSETANAGADRRRRWETLCQRLEERRGAAIILLAGPDSALRVHKNLSGRLMPREAAAVLTRCAAWLGDDAVYAAMARAVNVPGVFISDGAAIEPDQTVCVCSCDASDEQIFDALNSVQGQKKTINNTQ